MSMPKRTSSENNLCQVFRVFLLEILAVAGLCVLLLNVSQAEASTWVKELEVDEKVKSRLLELSPSTYIGLAEEITERVLKQ